MIRKCIAPLTLAAALAAAPLSAQTAGDWTLSLGLGNVKPQSSTGELAGAASSISSNTQLTLGFGYFLTENLAVDVLAATPFKHKIALAGLGDVGSSRQLPPTISLQYHLHNASPFTPFVGAGLNYTHFFNTKSSGAIAGQHLKIEDSFGLALQVGVDSKISEQGAIRTDLRWMKIESDVLLDGAKIGRAKINPLVAGISYVHRF